MRVIVCGGRDYDDYPTVRRVLTAMHPEIVTIVEGGAAGADRLARNAATDLGLGRETFDADWNRHGKAAGVIRNQQMLDAGADLVIAFPGGRGTADMAQRARKAGVPVVEIAS